MHFQLPAVGAFALGVGFLLQWGLPAAAHLLRRQRDDISGSPTEELRDLLDSGLEPDDKRRVKKEQDGRWEWETVETPLWAPIGEFEDHAQPPPLFWITACEQARQSAQEYEKLEENNGTRIVAQADGTNVTAFVNMTDTLEGPAVNMGYPYWAEVCKNITNK